jgi:hypothetical protein
MEEAVRAEEALAGANTAHLGRSNRRSFFCEHCQVRYT